MSLLSQPMFHDEKAAYAFLESVIWPDGPVCPHGGGVERIYELKGQSTRIGVHKCGQCRKPFTVKVGTVFESSHVPLHKWLQATYLMCASKKGISAHQLHRMLEARGQLSDRVVHGAPYARGHAFGRAGAYGRARWHRRG